MYGAIEKALKNKKEKKAAPMPSVSSGLTSAPTGGGFTAIESALKRKDEIISSSAKKDIGNLYNKYNELVGSAEKRYAQAGYRADYSTWKDQTATSTSELSSMSKNLRRKIDSYRTIYGDEYADSVLQLIDGIDKGVVALNDAAENEYKIFSQYATEEDYNNAVAAYEEEQRLLTYDVDAAQARVKELNDNLARVMELYDERKYAMQSGNKEAVAKAEEELVKLSLAPDLPAEQAMQNIVERYNRQIDALEDEIDLAKSTKEVINWNSISDPNSELYDPDFERYVSIGADTKNKPKKVYYDNSSQEYVSANDKGIQNPAAFVRNGGRIGNTDSNYDFKLSDDAKRYLAMSEEEFEMYNYFLGKYGKKRAEEYIDWLEKSAYSLTARVASKEFEEILQGNRALEYFYGVVAGLDQFGTGIRNLFSNKDYYRPSVTQYKSSYVREDLKNSGPQVAGNSLGQIVYDVTTTSSAMMPSILTSVFVGSVNPVAGEVAGSALMGASASGNAYAEMVNLGYSKGQARTYSLLVGASEATLQYLLGGIGKLGGKLSSGVTKGLVSKLDDILAKVAINYGDDVVKALQKGTKAVTGFTVDALSEGLEESLQEVIDPLFKAVALGDYDAEVDWEEALYSGILGVLTSAGMNTTSAAYNKVSQAVINKNTESFTQNEQVVFDKIVENRIAEIEARGEKVTSAEKKNIEKSVRQEFENGEISTSDIEEALEDNWQPNVEQDKRIILSYVETALRGEKFSADLSKYSEKQRAVVQSAIDSGILNNSSRTHKFVDFVAKLAEDKGVNFSFINNQKLKESGFAIEGKDVAGYVKGNDIAVNIDSSKSLNSIVGHEIAHVLEGTELYDVLATAVKNYATTKGEWDSRLKNTAELYSGISEDAEGELVADLIGDYLFTDSKFLERLSVEHQNLFQRLWSEVKYLCRIATAGSKEARQLEKVKKAFEDAYRNTKTAEKSTDTNSDGVRYAIGYTESNDPVVIVEENILDGVPKKDWVKTVKQTISGKFSAGIPINGRLIKVNQRTGREFTNSKYSKYLKSSDGVVYEDKFKSANNLDEIVLASTNYINEDLKHKRKDNFIEFARGNVLIKVGENDYSAKVIVGFTSGKQMVLYDVVDFSTANFNIKKESTPDNQKSKVVRNGAPSKNIISNSSQNVNKTTKNSLVSENQSREAVGDYNVYGRDVKLASDEVVPVQERQSKTLQEEFEDFLSGTTDTEKKNDIFNSFRITKPNDYIHVQRQVFNTLKNEGFFTSEDSRSRTDVNEESGMVVETNKSGIDETFSLMNYKRLSTANKLLKLETVRRIPEIIRTGTLVGDNVSNYHNAKKGTTFAYIESKVEVGGKEVAVKIDIKKSPQKNKFWVHSVDILEKAGELPADVDTTLKQGKHYTDYDDSVTDAEENVNSISETKELLKVKLSNLQTELSNNQQNRTKSSESFDAQIQKLQEKYDSKKTKNSKVANDILRSIERAKRLKANVDADYAKRISDIESKIKNVNRELQKDHTELDRLQKAYRRIDSDLEQEKAELVKEFEKKRADAEKTRLGEETVYFKERARQLYNELEKFEDWKVPSATLERILDLTYSEKDIKAALINISNVPSPVLADTTNPVETALRRILSEERANALENIEEGLNRELQDELSALETKAEEKKQLAHRANRARLKREQLAREAMTRLGNTMFWREKRYGIQYATNTERRNLQDIVRDEKGNLDLERANAIDDWLMGEYNHNEASLNKESARIKKQFADMKINRVESEYIQMLGEFRHNPATTLEEQDVMNFYENNYDKIDEKKVEKAIELARKVYDDLFERVNAVLREHGMKEIPYRKGYFPHFVEEKQGVIAKLFNWKKKNNDIPTDIAGITENFNPSKSYQSIDKQRKGDTTTYNFLEGLDRYVQGSLDWIYHIGDIQKRRAVESYIRYTHSEKGVQEQIDALENRDDLSADDFEREKQAIFAEKGNPLGRFLIDFRARTNTLAGKKSTYDRNMEEMINRDVYTTVQNIQARNSANIVVGSISSALTNLIPITQSWGEVSPSRSAEAILETIKSCIRDDGVVEKSAFLTNRLRAAEKLNKTTWDKIIDKAGIMMEYIDLFSSQVIWRSKFNQNIAEGMGETEAIKNADQFSENVMAGRSRGNMPTAFDSKNLLLKCFTSFQLEVNNQYGYMFKDMPRDMKNKGLAKLTLGYVGVFAGAHLFNCVYSMLTGRDSAFDPLSIVGDLLKDLGIVGDEDDKEEKVSGAVVNLLKNVLEEVPFLNIAVGGGRVPISSAIPYDTPWDFVAEGLVKDLVGGESPETFRNEMFRSLGYSVLPVGGGQIKKMVEGGLMYYTNDKRPIAGSYTDSGKLRFTAEKDFFSVLQNVLFGQYSSSTARDYFDEGRSPLTDKQLNVFVQMGEDMTIQEYWDFLDEISAINKAKKNDKSLDAIKMKVEYIVSLDLPLSKKNILVNSILNRKNPVDLQGFGKLSGFAEWDFSMQNEEKYQFLKDNGISYQLYASSEDVKERYDNDYQWYKSNPEKVTLSKAVTGTVVEYREIARQLNSIKADKDEDGNPISGSAKEKRLDYINSLDDLEYGAKLILYKDLYPSDDSVNEEIIEYVNSLDLTAAEKKTILKELKLG